MIDLHAHSSTSDGTSTPAELMREAREAGLDVIALTDHDTAAGWDEATAALPPGLTLIPGAELSCKWEHIEVHLLAYLFDPNYRDLSVAMASLISDRSLRAKRMIDLIRADGVEVTWDQVSEIADGGAVGRPHVARALVSSGVVETVDQAFAPDYLGRRWRLPKAALEISEAIQLVRAAGGIPVLAHPRATRRGPVVSNELIAELAEVGLFGLEAHHTDHTDSERDELIALAAKVGLAVTGSSDYHGENKTVQLGANTTSRETYEKLVAESSGTVPRAFGNGSYMRS